MKIKVHKIKNVPIDTCTCEQKIAYNLAFANSDYVKNAGFSSVGQASHKLIEFYKNGYDYKEGRYNLDAIFAALNAGLIEYVKKPFIAADYETIGKAFPILYAVTA